MGKLKILVVDNEEDIRTILSDRLEMNGYEVVTASDGMEALKKIEETSPELVLLDIKMPKPDGMQVLSRIKSEHPETIVIMITANYTADRAVEAIQKQGAHDFIEKPLNLGLLMIKINEALKQRALEREDEDLSSELKGEYSEIIWKSQKMTDVLKRVERIAPSDLTVLIIGETGTGKDLIARALYQNSLRRDKEFISVNSATISPELAESNLFGHEKGSFTSATSRQLGKFEVANDGTIFLDEVGDLRPEIQVKLLRVLENGTFQRVGGNEEIQVDVRLIAATNQDLKKSVQEGKFREDLFFRLYGVEIVIPPLRERKEDIPVLTRHFLQKAASGERDIQITDEAMELLENYHWPGNVRELKQCIESTAVLADSSIIRLDDLPLKVKSPESDQAGIPIPLSGTKKEMERELILKTLEEEGGNRTRTAKRLGISLRTLQTRLSEYKKI